MSAVAAHPPSEDAPHQPGANCDFCIPDWVPPAVTALARKLYAVAIIRPPGLLGAHATAVARLATDPRMRKVWVELRRHSGGAHCNGDYVHPAREQVAVAWPGFEGIGELAQQANCREELQELAASLLFGEASGFFVWDRRLGFGPRTQTKAELQKENRQLRALAQRVLEDRDKLQAFGLWEHCAAFERAAKDLETQAHMRRPDPRNPYIVERRSNRVGDDWERGFIIKLAGTCRALFGSDMLGTVATLGNVAFARNDLTIGKLRGVLRAHNRRTSSR
jgi:hypothetical protein